MERPAGGENHRRADHFGDERRATYQAAGARPAPPASHHRDSAPGARRVGTTQARRQTPGNWMVWERSCPPRARGWGQPRRSRPASAAAVAWPLLSLPSGEGSSTAFIRTGCAQAAQAGMRQLSAETLRVTAPSGRRNPGTALPMRAPIYAVASCDQGCLQGREGSSALRRAHAMKWSHQGLIERAAASSGASSDQTAAL